VTLARLRKRLAAVDEATSSTLSTYSDIFQAATFAVGLQGGQGGGGSTGTQALGQPGFSLGTSGTSLLLGQSTIGLLSESSILSQSFGGGEYSAAVVEFGKRGLESQGTEEVKEEKEEKEECRVVHGVGKTREVGVGEFPVNVVIEMGGNVEDQANTRETASFPPHARRQVQRDNTPSGAKVAAATPSTVQLLKKLRAAMDTAERVTYS